MLVGIKVGISAITNFAVGVTIETSFLKELIICDWLFKFEWITDTAAMTISSIPRLSIPTSPLVPGM